MSKKVISKEEFKQIEAMFSNFKEMDGLIGRLDGMIEDTKEINGDLKETKGNLKGLGSDMRSLNGVFEAGFNDVNKGISEIKANIDKKKKVKGLPLN